MIDHKTFSDNELTGMMHSAGLRPSLQRIAVFNLVANSKKHPTADEIFSNLTNIYPSLSRTTVYNSLHALVEAGLIRELEIDSGNKHYDLAPQAPHSHFICKACGRIFDMAIPSGIKSYAEPGFCVDSVDVYYKGVCPDCSLSATKSE